MGEWPRCGGMLNSRGQCTRCGYCSGWSGVRGLVSPKGKFKIKRSVV